MPRDQTNSPRPPGATSEKAPEAPVTLYSDPTPAQRIRELLLRANLSQRAGARELGVDERTMRYWCAGDTTPPRMAFLALERLVDMGRQLSDSTPDGGTEALPQVTGKDTE